MMDVLEDFDARSQNEIEYDKIILCELREGKSIRQAVQIAETKYPDETWLIRSDEDLANLKNHYMFLAHSISNNR